MDEPQKDTSPSQNNSEKDNKNVSESEQENELPSSGKVSLRGLGIPVSPIQEKKQKNKTNLIIEMCQKLLFVCDGAHTIDGKGFNKLDAGFVRSVLKQDYPQTPKQLRSLGNLLRKYHRQLEGFGYSSTTITSLEDLEELEAFVNETQRDVADDGYDLIDITSSIDSTLSFADPDDFDILSTYNEFCSLVDIHKHAQEVNSATFYQENEKGKQKLVFLRVAEHILTTYLLILTPSNQNTKDPAMWWYDASCGIWRSPARLILKSIIQQLLKGAANNYNIREIIGTIQRLTTTSTEFDSHPFVVCFKNGALDIQAFESYEHHPRFLLTKQLNVIYNPDAQGSAIDAVFNDWLPGNTDLLEEILGYCLESGYPIQKAIMIVGSAGTAKTAFINLIMRLLGMGNVACVSLQQMVERPFMSARLQGKFANISDDLPQKIIADNLGVFKSLVGFGAVTAEHKKGHPFEFFNTAKMIFTCNTRPNLAVEDEAFYDKWVHLEFATRFRGTKKEIRMEKLLAKLTTQDELSHLLNRALNGLKRLRENNRFSVGSEQDDPEENRMIYLRRADSVKYFVETCMGYQTDEDTFISKDALYTSYCTFCNAIDTTPRSREYFNKKLRSYYPATFERELVQIWKKIDDKNKRCWQGVTCKIPEEIMNPEAKDKIKKDPLQADLDRITKHRKFFDNLSLKCWKERDGTFSFNSLYLISQFNQEKEQLEGVLKLLIDDGYIDEPRPGFYKISETSMKDILQKEIDSLVKGSIDVSELSLIDGNEVSEFFLAIFQKVPEDELVNGAAPLELLYQKARGHTGGGIQPSEFAKTLAYLMRESKIFEPKPGTGFFKPI